MFYFVLYNIDVDKLIRLVCLTTKCNRLTKKKGVCCDSRYFIY